MNKLRTLVWDIETAPGEAYFFDPLIRFLPHGNVKSFPFMICWSGTFLGEGEMYSDYLTPDEIDRRDDSRIVESVANLLREADYAVAHHGDKFDIPWVRGRAWANNLEPLGPVQTIDTKKLAARDFYMTHNNLDALAKVRGLAGKTKTDFSWWTDILELDPEGQEKAMKRMLRYNMKDVKVLANVYESMIPHVTRLPRLVDGDGIFCQWCGGTQLQKRGKKRTAAYTYQQYMCKKCERYSTSKTHDNSNVSDLRPN